MSFTKKKMPFYKQGCQYQITLMLMIQALAIKQKMDIVLILGMSFLPGLKVQLVEVGLTY